MATKDQRTDEEKAVDRIMRVALREYETNLSAYEVVQAAVKGLFDHPSLNYVEIRRAMIHVLQEEFPETKVTLTPEPARRIAA